VNVYRCEKGHYRLNVRADHARRSAAASDDDDDADDCRMLRIMALKGSSRFVFCVIVTLDFEAT